MFTTVAFNINFFTSKNLQSSRKNPLLNWQMKIKTLWICQLFVLNSLENIVYFDLFSVGF